MRYGLILLCLLIAGACFSQDMKKFNLYKPEENAGKEIAACLKKAKDSGKHVFIQIGGNWCIWCARFDEFVTNDAKLDSLLKADFVVYHLNYSKENENNELLKNYKFPQRFGFPAFLILNDKGDLIHTENSAYLEDGKGYSKDKIAAFLQAWNVKALDPKSYQEK